MLASRRSFITGLVAFVAAPAIVRAGSLMPVKKLVWPSKFVISDYVGSDPVELDVLWGQIQLSAGYFMLGLGERPALWKDFPYVQA